MLNENIDMSSVRQEFFVIGFEDLPILDRSQMDDLSAEYVNNFIENFPVEEFQSEFHAGWYGRFDLDVMIGVYQQGADARARFWEAIDNSPNYHTPNPYYRAMDVIDAYKEQFEANFVQTDFRDYSSWVAKRHTIVTTDPIK